MFPTRITRSFLLTGVAGAVLCGVISQAASAQQSRGSSVFRLLMSKSTADALKLTDGQQSKIRDLSRKARLPSDQYKPFLERLKQAKTEAEKTKIRAEMGELRRKHAAKAAAEAVEVLTADQKTQFTTLRFRAAGSRAILFEDVVTKLGIDDDQKKKIGDHLKQRFTAYYRLSFRDRRDKAITEKFNSEWDGKLVALLTPEQRDGWKTLTGVSTTAGKTADPKSSDPKTVTNTVPSKPAVKRFLRKPVGKYVASFNAGQAKGVKQPATTYGTGVSAKRSRSTTKEKRFLSFNFENAPWKIVLEYFAKQAGLTLDLTIVPPDTFNYRDPNLYTITEALDIMNGYLLAKKFLLIRRDKFLVAHNLENPVPQSIIPDVSPEDLPYRGRNELMRVSFPLNADVDVKETEKELEGMVSPDFGKVLSFNGARRIIVTDIGTNLLRIQKLLGNIEPNPKDGDLAFKAFTCKFISATDAAKIVAEQLDASRNTRNVSSGRSSGSSSNSSSNDRRERFRQMMARFSRSRSSRGRTSTGSTTSSRSTQKTGNAAVRVTADTRTNNVLVLATAGQIKLAEGIMLAIDIPITGSNNLANNRANLPYFKVYRVSIDPTEVTRTLSVLMPDNVINDTTITKTIPSTSTSRFRRSSTTTVNKGGTIHIMATADEHVVIKELIDEMDNLGDDGGGVQLEFVQLKGMDALAVATTLTTLFSKDGTDAPSIQADVRGRRLIIYATKKQIAQIKTLVARLDSESNSLVTSQSGKGIRILNVPNPETLLPLLQKMWDSKNTGNAIRIVIPNRPSPIRQRVYPGTRGNDIRNDGPRRTTTNRDDRPLWKNFRRTTQIPKISSDAVAILTPDDIRRRDRKLDAKTSLVSVQNGKSQGTTQTSSKPSVVVTILNGQIVITSDDKDALDKMQKLIETLAPLIPVRISWTVFYLQAADCTDAASMLEQLFPTSTVATTAGSGGLLSGITGGVANFGNALVNMSGLSLGTSDSLRIIPDVRSNALFISGPSSKIRAVEQMLNVLDTTDLPSTLRDRVPRMIPVRYADVNEVATIVQNVYKDYMQGSSSSSRQNTNFNPLAMLMGGNSGRGRRSGRGGRSSGGSQQPVRLTLGVDTRTGQLIVSANDTLYRQIEEMVYRLDESAYKAERTTRVVQLKNATPSVVTEALTAMYPNISVSVTSNRTSTSGTGAGSRTSGQPRGFGGRSPDDAARAQRIQQFLQNRGRGGTQPGGAGRRSGRFGGGGSRGGGSRGGGGFRGRRR